MQNTASYELSLARDHLGEPLDTDTKTKIEHYISTNSPGDWEDIANVTICNDPPLSLWQSVEILYPGQSGRVVVSDDPEDPIIGWMDSPSPEAVRAALCFATH